MTLFKIWLLNLMLTFSPPEKVVEHQAFPGWEETVEERKERYADIADDVIEVVWGKDEHGAFKNDSVFLGPQGRARTAALLLAVAFHESGYAPDVDKGPCYMGKYGKNGRCDGGRSVCMLQVMVGREYVTRTGEKIVPRTREGWTAQDLFEDRTKCFRAGMAKMRASMRMCARAGLPLEHQLTAYGAGTCDRPAGKRGSERLIGLYKRFWDRHEVPKLEAAPRLSAVTPDLLTQQPSLAVVP